MPSTTTKEGIMAKATPDDITTALDGATEPGDPEAPKEFALPDDDELLVKAANMNIHRYTPHEKPGIYDDQVDTLIRVDEETGYQNSIEVLVPAGEVKKHKRYFSQSAAKRDKTARVVNGEEGVAQGDGGRLLEFVLTAKVHRKNGTAKPAATSTDTPQEAPAA